MQSASQANVPVSSVKAIIREVSRLAFRVILPSRRSIYSSEAVIAPSMVPAQASQTVGRTSAARPYGFAWR